MAAYLLRFHRLWGAPSEPQNTSSTCFLVLAISLIGEELSVPSKESNWPIYVRANIDLVKFSIREQVPEISRLEGAHEALSRKGNHQEPKTVDS